MNKSNFIKTEVPISWNRPYLRSFLLSVTLLFLVMSKGMAQRVTYNLSDLQSKGSLIAENRKVSPVANKKNAVRLSAAEGPGVVWLKNVEFSNGTIEVDVRGKDVKQVSFLGIAFHGNSKDNYEAVYFRPFNFLSKDSAQRAHMVQYVLEPEYGWERLRNEHPGVYENKLTSPPDPADWFHMKVEVKGEIIKVYLNHSTTPCLQVKSLNKQNKGKIGLWVGNSSDGDFANFVVN